MTDKDRMIATELKKKLLEAVRLVDFKVFGSRARGDAEPDSDMDLFIEVEELDKQIKSRIRDIVWKVGLEHDLYISPVIFTRHEIEDTPLRAAPLVKNIAEEGVRV